MRTRGGVKAEKRIKRDGARALLAAFGRDMTERARNYELERELAEMPSLNAFLWVVDEPCPFNGAFCQWGKYCDDEDAAVYSDVAHFRDGELKAWWGKESEAVR